MIDFGAATIGPALQAFGQPVTYQPANAAPIALTAIFDDRYRRTKFDDRGVEIVTFSPILGCRASDFPSGLPTRDELMVVAGRLYRVVDTDPDGFGHVLIVLMIAPPGRLP